MSNETIDVTSEGEGGIRHVMAIVEIAIIIGGVVASLLLILSTACQRTLRVPFYVVMASWALSNLICSAVLALDVMVKQQGSWPFPGMVCKYYEYVVQAVALIRLYHMPLAAIISCFSHRFPVWFRSRPWANVVIPVVLCLYVWVAFFILAVPYIGSREMVHFQDTSICHYRNRSRALAVNSVLLYWVPFLLSFVMLIVWACVFVRRPRAPDGHVWRRENSEGMVLFIVIYIFVVSRLALIVVVNLQTLELFQTAHGLLRLVYRIVSIIANSDYFLAPFICLLFVGVYRNIFCLPCRGQTGSSNPPPEPAAIPLKSDEYESEADWAFSGL